MFCSEILRSNIFMSYLNVCNGSNFVGYHCLLFFSQKWMINYFNTMFRWLSLPESGYKIRVAQFARIATKLHFYCVSKLVERLAQVAGSLAHSLDLFLLL